VPAANAAHVASKPQTMAALEMNARMVTLPKVRLARPVTARLRASIGIGRNEVKNFPFDGL
jgi:hypothetical protein